VNAKASTPDEGAFHPGQLEPIIDSVHQREFWNLVIGIVILFPP
jgi:hypothetical protein